MIWINRILHKDAIRALLYIIYIIQQIWARRRLE